MLSAVFVVIDPNIDIICLDVYLCRVDVGMVSTRSGDELVSEFASGSRVESCARAVGRVERIHAHRVADRYDERRQCCCPVGLRSMTDSSIESGCPFVVAEAGEHVRQLSHTSGGVAVTHHLPGVHPEREQRECSLDGDAAGEQTHLRSTKGLFERSAPGAERSSSFSSTASSSKRMASSI